jgi:hypothetical protein
MFLEHSRRSTILFDIFMILVLVWAVHGVHAQETRDEQVAASQELGAFADSHQIEYWACEPVGQTWTTELGSRGGKDDSPLLWHEEGYARLIEAVSAVEQDYTTYPEGHSGHANN